MKIIVLSPHRDDAAFSCSLTLSNLLKAGHSLTIVNIFTISRYAPYFIEDCNDSAKKVTALRRDEDAVFVEMMRHSDGAQNGHVELVDLEYQDMPLRWRMRDEQTLAHSNLPPEEVQELANAFRALPPCDLVFAPMAVGGHIDHRLVLQAATETFSVSSLALYEDLPYACRMPEPERRLSLFQHGAALTEAWLPMHGSIGELKLQYALCYPSQIATDVANEMQTYAMDHGGRERFLAGVQAMRILTACLHNEVNP